MLQIEIRVKGCISQQWSDWFDGLTIHNPAMGETLLAGIVADQAALYGIIARLRDLGLSLASLGCEEIAPAPPPDRTQFLKP
jgi:hypothetical protein